MTSTAIDLAVFNELQATAGEDFVAELVDTFLEEAPQMFRELRAALRDGDAERFRRAAHSLKSNGHTFGAATLGAMARELELGGLPPDATAIDATQTEYVRVAAALKRACNG
ncbi:MAG: Hpt domain-containing protein [Rhizobacter sp.]|jgi:HPt (histidine-containing phosphotransfer) domain-containing protein|nr:Hpt domain-containing protein [Burkholderiaceae bacterium]MCO5123808.1 Hpt domain-containing protein [Rhizobacter sp.]